jgi:hypothetical protein
MVNSGLRGVRVEIEKTEIVQHHAREMVQQAPGDHHTYTIDKRFKSRPSLTSLLRRA